MYRLVLQVLTRPSDRQAAAGSVTLRHTGLRHADNSLHRAESSLKSGFLRRVWENLAIKRFSIVPLIIDFEGSENTAGPCAAEERTGDANGKLRVGSFFENYLLEGEIALDR